MKILSCFLVIFSFSLLSCNLNDLSGTNDNNQETADLEFSISLAKAPVDIISMNGYLAKSGEDTIKFDFTIQDDKATCKVKDIKPGEWELTVNAYNANYELAYSGSTKVTIRPGEDTTIYLHLDPATGSLRVIVTWGDDVENMILMARDSLDMWHIVSMDINGNNFKDLGYGMYPVWPTKDHSIIYFLSDYYTLCELDLKANIKKVINYLPYNTNFLRYSKSLDKFLFDFRVSKYTQWQLGMVNTDGSDFQIILEDSYYKKYPSTAINDNWIYFHKQLSKKKEIYRIKPNGTHEELFITENGSAEFPSISYDDKNILYTKTTENHQYFLVIRDINSLKVNNIIELTSFGTPTYPTFSKDGRYIVVSIITGDNWDDRQLFRINNNESEITQITYGNDYKYYARPLFW